MIMIITHVEIGAVAMTIYKNAVPTKNQSTDPTISICFAVARNTCHYYNLNGSAKRASQLDGR